MPVINHPQLLLNTGRQHIAELLRHVPELWVPRIARLRLSELRQIRRLQHAGW